MARAETYQHAKFHLDRSNRLATVHERHRQTGQTGQRSDSIGRTFYKRSPKNCQRQSCNAINFLSSGINILAGGSSVPLIYARKGTDPPLKARAFLIARQSPTSVTSLRWTHWLASDFHSWINSWIHCQTNVYTI